MTSFDSEHDRFVEGHGGVCPPDALSPLTASLLAPTGDLFQAFVQLCLKDLRRKNAGYEVEWTVVGNPKYNASAWTGQFGGHIAVYRGLLEGVTGFVFAALSDPLFLPQVGDPTLERASPHMVWDESASCYQVAGPLPIPNCPKRQHFASMLTSFAFLSCLLHELGHLAANSTLLDELKFDKLIRELDADCFASHMLWIMESRMRDTTTRFLALAGWRDISPEDASVVLGILGSWFLLRISPQGTAVGPTLLDAHPPAGSRIWLMLANAGNGALRNWKLPRRAIPDSLGSLVIELEHAWARWTQCSLPDPHAWRDQLNATRFECSLRYLDAEPELDKHRIVKTSWRSQLSSKERTKAKAGLQKKKRA